MNSFRKEDAQSFLLRFWYEQSQMVGGHWRGTIWNQQNGQENHRAFFGPDEAFEIIRDALAQATPPVLGGSSGNNANEPLPVSPGKKNFRESLADLLRRTLGREQ